jgi:hypothetical protein
VPSSQPQQVTPPGSSRPSSQPLSVLLQTCSAGIRSWGVVVLVGVAAGAVVTAGSTSQSTVDFEDLLTVTLVERTPSMIVRQWSRLKRCCSSSYAKYWRTEEERRLVEQASCTVVARSSTSLYMYMWMRIDLFVFGRRKSRKAEGRVVVTVSEARRVGGKVNNGGPVVA